MDMGFLTSWKLEVKTNQIPTNKMHAYQNKHPHAH